MKFFYTREEEDDSEIFSTPTTLKNRNRSKIGSLLVLLIFGLAMLMPSNMNAQTVVDIFNLPPARDCRSNDLHAINATLVFPLCGPECQEGDVTYYDITLAIDNTTNSERTNFAFYARLEQYNPDGSLANTYFVTGCNGPVAPDGITEVTYNASLVVLDEDGNPTGFPGIPYLCGGSLKLINVYQAWTAAADNKTCPLNPSLIAPKCDVIASLEIDTPIAAVVESITDATCNGDLNGAIDINVNGGTPEYTYLWSNGAITQDLSGIAAGTYSVTVTDDNGCTDTLTGIEVGEPDELEAVVDSTTDATCNGALDGAINIGVSGGTPGYTYMWSNGATTQDLSGIAAGTYSVTVTDANGCTDTLTGIEVGEPDELEAVLDSTTDATCNGALDGAINIGVSGGTPGYTYMWSNGATTQDLSGIAAGTYSVTVTDANGCTDTLTGIEVGEPDELEAVLDSTTDATCNGALDGAINIGVSGGTPGYTYMWSNGATTQDLSGIAAGTYSVTVTDANGCTDTLTGIEVDDPSSLEAVVDSTTDATCNGALDGAINISVSGGTPGYTYMWSNGATTQDLSGIAAGTYSVTVTDDNGCTDTLTGIEVGEPDELEAALDSTTDATCNGALDGAINIGVSGGTPGYTYMWSNGATTQDLSGIAAGTYSVTVTDANGCTDTLTGIEVGEPDELEAVLDSTTDATCNGALDGAINIGVSGGTPGYTYMWSNGATTQDLSGIAAGTYSVTVTDDNGCTDTLTGIEVGEPSELSGSAVPTAESCAYNDGSIALTVIGGTPPYTYLWNNGAITQNLSGLAAGAYSVTITDANACQATTSATVNAPGNCIVDEGCTPGYWKNHLEAWGSVDPNADFFVFFGIDDVGDNVQDIIGTSDQNGDGKLTLLEAISAEIKTSKNNGWFAALARHAVAAYLNASNPDVGYEYSTSYILEQTRIAFETNYTNRNQANSAAQLLHNRFRIANERVCPLGNETRSALADTSVQKLADPVVVEESVVVADFSVSPVPFRESLSVRYDFDYVSNAVIQIFDLQGRLLLTQKEANASQGKVTDLSINFRILPSQVYVIKVTTDRDVFTKKIISDK